MRRSLIIAAALGSLAFGAGAALAGPASDWSWVLGDSGVASVGEPAGTANLDLGAQSGNLTDVSMSGAELQLAGTDGNFEFEHSPASAFTRFAAQLPDGSPTPLVIGTADGQDVTPLIVRGDQAMSSPIQVWQTGDGTLAAISPQGQISFNGITIEPAVLGGAIVLEAVLPNGTTQTLVSPSEAAGQVGDQRTHGNHRHHSH